MQTFRSSSTSARFRRAAPLGVLALAVVVAGCSRKADEPPAASADTWATVDGRSIMRDEVDTAFRRSQDPAVTLSPEEAMTLKLSLLNEMILQDILVAKARELKIEVPESELDAAYAERKKNMAEAAFEEELKKRDISGADMRESLRRELLVQKLLEQEVASKITVTEQEIQAFFEANRAQFTLAEESYHIAQIVITPDAAGQQVNRTGNDAATPQEAAFKLRMVMERLKTGASFADVAMDYSEDPETSVRGGDLGLVPVSALKQAPEPLRKAVIGQKPGSVNVVSTDGAHSVVAVIAHEQAGERGLSTPGVTEGIRETLKTRKEQLLRTAYLSAARSGADVTNHAARRILESQGKVQ